MAGALLGLSAPAVAQVIPCSTVEKSANLPPTDSPPLLRCYELVFHPDGAQRVDNQTYLFYLSPVLQPSLRSQSKWVPYKKDDALTAFSRLWRTGLLDDFWVEVIDEPYENGVIGKHVVFHLEERPPVKVVDFVGSKEVETAKIENALKNVNAGAGGFVREEYSLIRACQKAILNLYAEEGFPNATVEIRKVPIPGELRLARLTFVIKEGPRNKKESPLVQAGDSRSRD
jgi:Surface antigen variable number repeat